MTRRPPTPTLFPYTTLFRSFATTDPPEPKTLEALAERLPHIRQSPQIEGTLALIVRRPQVDAREVLAEGELNTIEDRKSRRLNSSHSQISYAVLCFKKKK